MGTYTALAMTHEAMAAADPAKLMRARGLSERQIAAELTLLSNALDFYNLTRHIDVAYDGFFVQKDLNTTAEVVGYTKPEYLFVDSESFTPWPVWLVSVGLSQNAARRRKPGESDADLAYRISKEFMVAYNSTVRDASGGHTALGFFGAMASRHGGIGSFPWSILQELGQLSQPGWYGQHNRANLQQMVNAMRTEKRALGNGPSAPRMIPWLTVATSGPTSPTACFDELVHVFLNGASGFAYYADIDFHDMEYCECERCDAVLSMPCCCCPH